MRSGLRPVLSRVARESIPGRTRSIVPPAQLARTVRARIAEGATLLWLTADWEGPRAWVRTVLDEPGDVLARVDAPLDEGDVAYTAVSSLVPSAAAYEHEARELAGVKPEGMPQDASPALAAFAVEPGPLAPGFEPEAIPFPRRTAFFTPSDPPDVVLGPIVASLAEPLVAGLWLDGDRVRRARLTARLKHRGAEHLATHGDVSQALAVAERICGCAPAAHAAAFLAAYEEAAGVDAGPQALAQRAVVTALCAVSSAAGALRGAARALSDLHAQALGDALEEEIRVTCERLSGHRYLRGMLTAAGLGRPVSSAGVLGLIGAAQRLEGGLARLGEAVLAHGGRLAGLGWLPPARAHAHGASGAIAQAEGKSGSDVATRFESWMHWGTMAARAVRDGAGVLAVPGVPRSGAAQASSLSGARLSRAPLGAGEGLGVAHGGSGTELCYVRLAAGRLARVAWRPPSIPHVVLAEQALAGADRSEVPLVLASFAVCVGCASR